LSLELRPAFLELDLERLDPRGVDRGRGIFCRARPAALRPVGAQPPSRRSLVSMSLALSQLPPRLFELLP
jgi:hypothetical protein